MSKLLCFLTVFLLSLSAHAEYTLSMERENPDIPISRSKIITKVEQQYEKSTILSIQSRLSNVAPDCHIIRLLKADGEMMQLEVAC